jgi:hypothetical protein
MQGRVGGRIYERTAEGVEHDWGEVTRARDLVGWEAVLPHFRAAIEKGEG